MPNDTIDQQFVQYIVESIVSQPDEVKIDRTIDEKGVLLELTVSPEDLGRVIGKRGNTAQSIRTLLRALGTKNDARYNLKIVDLGSPAPAKEATAAADTVSDDPAQVVDDEVPEIVAASNGVDAWAHLKSDDPEEKGDDTTSGDGGAGDESSTVEDKKDQSVVEKTRKELEDLAGIDI